ncbi:hypothetical protein TVAG_204060 [Trichomonas vaginalis G3]|uniref:Uncharacterized protein n=1 Tax=Trichomonas vaginalis (strain ATCC PRA-98 / G3) TaxID=412133 RepID=A2FXT6_TRIV3|nr:Ankyrin repeat family [Trichomonas vaginalis G3]EAX90271.1 hypothetical protein TVAG_204060 [Trichomonas vaginalis G3]KAI5508635.1 Ankyrin repeat family [Trichomonas vaginalis G3]|eukprot:XP_001303201.1 hypothetical protein [Trichomonas vaginalis G3]
MATTQSRIIEAIRKDDVEEFKGIKVSGALINAELPKNKDLDCPIRGTATRKGYCPKGATQVMYCAACGATNVLKHILDSYKNVDLVKNIDGFRAFHCAVITDDPACFHILLKKYFDNKLISDLISTDGAQDEPENKENDIELMKSVAITAFSNSGYHQIITILENFETAFKTYDNNTQDHDNKISSKLTSLALYNKDSKALFLLRAYNLLDITGMDGFNHAQDTEDQTPMSKEFKNALNEVTRKSSFDENEQKAEREKLKQALKYNYKDEEVSLTVKCHNCDKDATKKFDGDGYYYCDTCFRKAKSKQAQKPK